MDRLSRLLAAHGSNAPVRVVQAPGRVNLLGEHTDYSGGFCMPAALNFNTLIAASPRTDSLLRLHSLDFNDRLEVNLRALPASEKESWAAYPVGVAWSLLQSGIKLVGGDLTITGDVPLGAGLSSSASVEVATATALLALAGAAMAKEKVALACQRAENEYVGAPCGIMDQFCSACGVAGNALAIDTRALTYQLAPLPDAVRLVVCNSMVKHSVAGGEYGQRRREVEEAARACGVAELRDATLADLEAAKGKMTDTAFKRGRHVITDSQRVVDGVRILRSGNVAEFGRLMVEAHASYRDDFEASCMECDLLVRLATELDGCLGARLTGGGFGGCTVNLVTTAQAEQFARKLAEQYQATLGIRPEVYICQLADGAGAVQQ